MGLQLDYTYKGIEANYWRINQFQYDDVTGEAVISLWLYKDKAASDVDKGNGLLREVITVVGVNTETLPEGDLSNLTARDAIKAMLYVKIKESVLDESGNEQNKWANSQDF